MDYFHFFWAEINFRRLVDFQFVGFQGFPKSPLQTESIPRKAAKKNLEMEELTGKKVFFLIIYKSKNQAIRKFNWMIQK